MPAGIQVFNADGSLQFDTSNRLFRVLTTATTGTFDGGVTVPGGASQGTLTATIKTTGAAVAPTISVSGDTVNWSFGSAPPALRESSEIIVMAY